MLSACVARPVYASHACICTYICIHTRTCTHVHTYTYIHTYMHTCISACMHICMHAGMHAIYMLMAAALMTKIMLMAAMGVTIAVATDVVRTRGGTDDGAGDGDAGDEVDVDDDHCLDTASRTHCERSGGRPLPADASCALAAGSQHKALLQVCMPSQPTSTTASSSFIFSLDASLHPLAAADAPRPRVQEPARNFFARPTPRPSRTRCPAA